MFWVPSIAVPWTRHLWAIRCLSSLIRSMTRLVMIWSCRDVVAASANRSGSSRDHSTFCHRLRCANIPRRQQLHPRARRRMRKRLQNGRGWWETMRLMIALGPHRLRSNWGDLTDSRWGGVGRLVSAVVSPPFSPLNNKHCWFSKGVGSFVVQFMALD